jgi:chromosome segregation ATPase
MSVRAQETEHLKLQLDHNKDELNRLTEKAQKLERKNFDLENKLESVQGGKGSFGLHRDSSKSISSP